MQKATYPEPIVTLQILRAIAALMVFSYHYGVGLVNFGALAFSPFQMGAFGVDIFFVVSGFIICLASEGETSPTRFIAKRLCRIIPIYWTLTFGVYLIAVVEPRLLGTTEADPVQLLKSLAFIPYARIDGSVQPLLFLGWTLNYEMFFYFIFAGSLLAGKFRIFVCIAIILALVVAGRLLQPASVPAAFYTSGVMLNFVWGCVAYLVWRRLGPQAAALSWLWMVGAGLLILTNFVSPNWPREYVYGLPSMLLLLGLTSVHIGNRPVWRFLQRIGDASYSLYLVHPYLIMPVFMFIFPAIGVGLVPVTLASMAALGLTLLVSFLSFRLIEKPSNTYLRRVFLSRPQHAA